MKVRIPSPKFLVVDLFCGAGGTSTGFALSGVAKVIACVNHDSKAIKSHWANHPDVKHFEEDIRTLDLRRLVRLVKFYRRRYPHAKLILWASLECTNHSNAKGGMPRDADSRTLAIHLDRYITALDPDYVQIENVKEFELWGPMRIKVKTKHQNRWDLSTIRVKKDGKLAYGWEPIKERKGEDFHKWRDMVKAHGYRDEWRKLNSADFGAYTSRERLFGIFAKPGLPIVWPKPTHARVKKSRSKKNKQPDPIPSSLAPWKAVKDVLDFSNEGHSIFNRTTNTKLRKQDRKDLSEKTLERIYAGLIKFIAGGKDAFMAKYMGNNQRTGINSGKSLDEPANTITCQSRLALVQPMFISKYNGGNPESRNTSLAEPCCTITTENRHALIQGVYAPIFTPFISKYYSGNPDAKNISIDGPAGTITCKDGQALIKPISFLANYYSSGGQTTPVTGPAPTLTVRDRCSLIYLLNYNHSSSANGVNVPSPSILAADKLGMVKTHFLDKQYGSNDNTISINQPAGTIVNNDKHALIQSESFIDRPFSSGGGQNSSIEEPAGSILSIPKMNVVNAERVFIMNTNFDNAATSVEDPHNTVTANRKWPYMVNWSFLFNPSWGSHATSMEDPSPVIIASQNKSPMYLVISDRGEIGIPVYETDSPCTKKIKEFMAMYGIVDIKMRMLVVPELLRIQGFPANYKLEGSQADQKKFIGNSVVPDVVKAWILALYEEYNEFKMAA